MIARGALVRVDRHGEQDTALRVGRPSTLRARTPSRARGTTIDQLHFAVLGPGRAGRTFAARIRAAGLPCSLERERPRVDGADVVLLAVPDDAIAGLAASFPAATWLVHLSGATPLAALGAGRTRAFVWHALQTLSGDGGSGQLDGVPVTVTAGSAAALEFALELGRRLALELHVLAEVDRPLPHLAAVLAGNGSVTLIAEATRLLGSTGLGPAAAAALLRPLVRSSVERALADAGAGRPVLPTGPVARGDATTVRRHREAIDRLGRPELDLLYVAVARATARLAGTDGALAEALASPAAHALEPG